MRASKRKSRVEKFVDFITKQIKENRTRFFTVIGFTFGLILIGIFIFARLQTLNESASDRLAAAYMAIMYGQEQQAVTHLNNAILYSGNTPAAYQARLLKADILMEKGEYKNSLALLEETEQKGKPELIRPLAMSRIIYLYDQQKDYPSAILYSNEFISKYGNSFLIRNVYTGLARYYMLSGSREDAKRVYGEILTKFPATSEAEHAAKMLQELM